MKRIDPLAYLSRSDKWYLGGGGRLLWAPPFPLFLDRPGFWDKAHYYNIEIQPLFTWTVLDEQGEQLHLNSQGRTWTPANLTQRFASMNNPAIIIDEQKVVLPNSVAASLITFSNRSRKRFALHVIVWTAQETYPSMQTTWLSSVDVDNDRLMFARHLRRPGRSDFACSCILGINHPLRSHSINLSEGTPPAPDWQITPFYEAFDHSQLPNERKLSGVTHDGLIFGALHTRIILKPHSKETFVAAISVAPNPQEASQNLSRTLKADPVQMSEMTWREYFGTVPYFECSDEYLTRYYWYRWYGLRLNMIDTIEGNYSSRFVCEGIGDFRAPISYSAPCHIMETRWMHTPQLAQGILETFIDNQREDGGFRGYIDVNHYQQDPFYHANWGRALLELENIHPSTEFLREAYDALKRYVQYFDRERDEEASGLYDVINHYETGQEYMSRYLVVNQEADRDNWGKMFRLKGVDATVYIYELKRALGILASRLGRTDDAELWNLEAEKIKVTILETMWDSKEEMFFDVDPATGKRTMVKAATCFYPYLTDMVSEVHLPGLRRHLFNKKEFWTPYPIPSSSADDEMFSALPEWKGMRMNCPWNGRVWPMTNSHVAEGLAQTAIRFNDSHLKKKTCEFISKFIRMMFFENDPKRPNSFEHYNPRIGKPSFYRGVDDYMHSWVNDLILKYVCGIRPTEGGVVIDPLPFRLRHLMIDDVIVQGRWIRMELHGTRYNVWVDGKRIGDSHPVGTRLVRPGEPLARRAVSLQGKNLHPPSNKRI